MLAQARNVVAPALVLLCSARLQSQSRPPKPPGLRNESREPEELDGKQVQRQVREAVGENDFKRADERLGICPAFWQTSSGEEVLSCAVDGNGCGMNSHNTKPTFLQHTKL